MDGSQLDRLARTWSALRSRRAATAVLGGLIAAPILAEAEVTARKKKKKKTCAKKCTAGCCTGKKGKCIQPDQQSLSQCGTGGAICRSTGCGGTCPNCGCSASKPCPAGQCCNGQGTCGACRVFATSTVHNGNLGGLAGADTICQARATAAGLPGTYLAWISDTANSPNTRFTRATVPYTLVDGTVIANNWADLVDGAIIHAMNMSETGGAPGFPKPWTNTKPNGTPSLTGTTGHCENWTTGSAVIVGMTGQTTFTTTSWTEFGPDECHEANSRYCFQQL